MHQRKAVSSRLYFFDRLYVSQFLSTKWPVPLSSQNIVGFTCILIIFATQPLAYPLAKLPTWSPLSLFFPGTELD